MKCHNFHFLIVFLLGHNFSRTYWWIVRCCKAISRIQGLLVLHSIWHSYAIFIITARNMFAVTADEVICSYLFIRSCFWFLCSGRRSCNFATLFLIWRFFSNVCLSCISSFFSSFICSFFKKVIQMDHYYGVKETRFYIWKYFNL